MYIYVLIAFTMPVFVHNQDILNIVITCLYIMRVQSDRNFTTINRLRGIAGTTCTINPEKFFLIPFFKIF